MTIVGVHGIGKYKYFEQGQGSPAKAAELMRAKWNRYFHDGGLTAAPVVEVAYYAHHLRKGAPLPPKKMAPAEKMVFTDWMRQVEDHRVAVAAGETLTSIVHRLAGWLLDRLGDGAMKFAEDFCPEVATYLGGGSPRSLSRDAVAEVIRRRKPRVVIAHSLGSVVTYEALWAHADLRAELLVTLGSPLGMRNVVFERLAPLPVAGMGAKPPGVKRWINIADKDDIAAIPTELRPVFGGLERDYQCNIDWLDFHTVRNYLGCGVLNSHLRDFLQ